MIPRRRRNNADSLHNRRQFQHSARRSFLRRPRHLRSKSSYRLVCMTRRSFVWALFLVAAGVLVGSHPDWIIGFLQGPKVSPPPYQEPASRQYQKPEEPRPINEKVFTAFTDRDQRKLKKMRQTFHEFQEQEGRLVPCRLDRDCIEPKNSVDISSSFFSRLRGSSSQRENVLFHNPLSFHRYICGKVIWGNGGILELESSVLSTCLSDAMPHVHTAHPPPLTGTGMRPIELFWNYDDALFYDEDRGDFQMETYETEDFECSIPCRKTGDYALLSIISVKDTKWEIISTMEGEKYYSQAKVKQKSYRRDQYYAVTSFRSEIPVPYFSWAEYDIQHQAVDFDKAIKGASFLANNCDSESKREELVLELMDTQLQIDSLSGCHHNAEAPDGVDIANKTAIQESYLLHLAFENQRSDDYITEKLWGALAAGTLPVYFGAPNVKEHVPPNSVVFVDDFPSTQDLASFLIRLTNDKVLYYSFHAWRSTPLDQAFQQKYGFTATHSTCRMCKWAYANMHGFQWNHTSQEVEQPHIAHKTCRNKLGLIGHPFKEYWHFGANQDAVTVTSGAILKTCTLDSMNRVLWVDDGRLRRKVYDQDGVTDLIVDVMDQSATLYYTLKLEVHMSTSHLKNVDDSSQEWWLQDSSSRMTILTNQKVALTLSDDGKVEIPVTGDLRVRVVVENVDSFHKGGKKYATYYGDLMKQDFFSPVQAFKVIR